MKASDLFEMPIARISHLGDFNKSSSFKDPKDRRLLTNPKALKKITGMWKFPEETMFNIILVNHPDGGKHTEVGEVSHDWCETNMPRIWAELEPLLDDSQVNVIFTNNKGDERVPLTGWIMAHRLGHCLLARQVQKPSYYMQEAMETFSRYVNDALEYYGIPFPHTKEWYKWPRNGPSLGFLHEICTFRAAREKNIRNPAEVPLELLAQYMVTGRVRFNEFPKHFRYGNKSFGFRGTEEERKEASRMFGNDLAYELDSFYSTALNYAEGHIFVM